MYLAACFCADSSRASSRSDARVAAALVPAEAFVPATALGPVSTTKLTGAPGLALVVMVTVTTGGGLVDTDRVALTSAGGMTEATNLLMAV